MGFPVTDFQVAARVSTCCSRSRRFAQCGARWRTKQPQMEKETTSGARMDETTPAVCHGCHLVFKNTLSVMSHINRDKFCNNLKKGFTLKGLEEDKPSNPPSEEAGSRPPRPRTEACDQALQEGSARHQDATPATPCSVQFDGSGCRKAARSPRPDQQGSTSFKKGCFDTSSSRVAEDLARPGCYARHEDVRSPRDGSSHHSSPDNLKVEMGGRHGIDMESHDNQEPLLGDSHDEGMVMEEHLDCPQARDRPAVDINWPQCFAEHWQDHAAFQVWVSSTHTSSWYSPYPCLLYFYLQQHPHTAYTFSSFPPDTPTLLDCSLRCRLVHWQVHSPVGSLRTSLDSHEDGRPNP
jgi:hypothetical protein